MGLVLLAADDRDRLRMRIDRVLDEFRDNVSGRGQKVDDLDADDRLAVIHVFAENLFGSSLFGRGDNERVPKGNPGQLCDLRSADDGLNGGGLVNPGSIGFHDFPCCRAREGCRKLLRHVDIELLQNLGTEQRLTCQSMLRQYLARSTLFGWCTSVEQVHQNVAVEKRLHRSCSSSRVQVRRPRFDRACSDNFSRFPSACS